MSRMSGALRLMVATLALSAVACTTTAPPLKPSVPANTPSTARFELVPWADVEGWRDDQLHEAWSALLAGCNAPRPRAEFNEFCIAARGVQDSGDETLRQLVEQQLQPWRVVEVKAQGEPREAMTGMITGYYEPVLNGSRERSGLFQTPLYGVPPDLLTIELGELYPALKGERVRGRLRGRTVVPYPPRSKVGQDPALKGSELAWVDSGIDAFFLQVQGSGRVQLPDGSVVRLAYADVNGQPYHAIGRYLVERGELTVEQATAPALRQWLAAHPERLDEVLDTNPSVVFFREEKIVDPTAGPRGAMGVALTAGRSVAIDPRVLPLGAPLFLSTTDPVSNAPIRRLVLAQDTGGAIRGPIRADLFWGLGFQAGDVAGRMRQAGSLWLLWPKDQPLPIAR
jgi:membrane-bound lytic murein transglycosylase A